MAERCHAITKRGKPCTAAALPDGLCAWHSPSYAERRRQWSARGGAARSNKVRAKKALPAADLTLMEVKAVLCQALIDVLEGRREPGVVNAAAGVARAIAAVAQVGELEERLAELERAAMEEAG